jgi:hypothetical protein
VSGRSSRCHEQLVSGFHDFRSTPRLSRAGVFLGFISGLGSRPSFLLPRFFFVASFSAHIVQPIRSGSFFGPSSDFIHPRTARVPSTRQTSVRSHFGPAWIRCCVLVSTNPDLSSDLVPLRFAFDFGACAFQSFRSSTCGSFSLWIFLVLLKAGLSWAVGSKTQVLSVLVEFFMMIS